MYYDHVKIVMNPDTDVNGVIMADKRNCECCAHKDENFENQAICTFHDSFIAHTHYKCDDYLPEKEGRFKEFTEWCPYCGMETHFDYADMDDAFNIICKSKHCREPLLACDFCKEYSNRFCESSKCHVHLTEAKQNYERRRDAS